MRSTEYFGYLYPGMDLCICKYVHNVVRSQGIVGGWKVAVNNRKLTHDFTTPIDSKYCSICHCVAAILRESFGIPMLGVMWEVHQPKSHPRLSNTSHYKVLLNLHAVRAAFCLMKHWNPPFKNCIGETVNVWNLRTRWLTVKWIREQS